MYSCDTEVNKVTVNCGSLQHLGSSAQAYLQLGYVEQELCRVFLSVWSLLPANPAQKTDLCLTLFPLFYLSHFGAQQRVLSEKISNHFWVKTGVNEIFFLCVEKIWLKMQS